MFTLNGTVRHSVLYMLHVCAYRNGCTSRNDTVIKGVKTIELSGHIDQSAFNTFAPSAVNARQTCRRAEIKEATRKWAGEL